MQCVKGLLELGMPTVAVVRSPEKYAETFEKSEKLQIKQGDVQDVGSLKAVLQDARVKHVIFAASGKTYWSAKDVDEQVTSLIVQLEWFHDLACRACHLLMNMCMHAELQGVANTVQAAKEAGGVDRIVLVSSALVTPKNRFGCMQSQ